MGRNAIAIPGETVIRSVIFDLGGTLVDYLNGAAGWRGVESRGIAALHRFLGERGHTLVEAEFSEMMWNAVDYGWTEAMAGCANVRLSDVITATVAHFGIVLDDEARLQAARVYAAAVKDNAVLFDGAHETLGRVKERGLRLGLLSNTMWPGQFHREEMQDWRLLDFFDETVFSSDAGLWKPNVPAFRYVTNRLGISPSETIFVGDQLQVDVLGAQRAGLRAVWVACDGVELSDAPARRADASVHPDAIIHRLAELPAVLAQWQSLRWPAQAIAS